MVCNTHDLQPREAVKKFKQDQKKPNNIISIYVERLYENMEPGGIESTMSKGQHFSGTFHQNISRGMTSRCIVD